jgi:hypothetical protein
MANLIDDTDIWHSYAPRRRGDVSEAQNLRDWRDEEALSQRKRPPRSLQMLLPEIPVRRMLTPGKKPRDDAEKRCPNGYSYQNP